MHACRSHQQNRSYLHAFMPRAPWVFLPLFPPPFFFFFCATNVKLHNGTRWNDMYLSGKIARCISMWRYLSKCESIRTLSAYLPDDMIWSFMIIDRIMFRVSQAYYRNRDISCPAGEDFCKINIDRLVALTSRSQEWNTRRDRARIFISWKKNSRCWRIIGIRERAVSSCLPVFQENSVLSISQFAIGSFRGAQRRFRRRTLRGPTWVNI